MKLHIDQNILERFYLIPESFSSKEHLGIHQHLESCKECNELLKHIKVLYEELTREAEEEATNNDKEFAQKLLDRLNNVTEKKLIKDKADSVRVYQGNFEIITNPNRFSLSYYLYLIKTYPVASFSFTAICVMAIAFMFNTVKTTFKDVNPVNLQIERSFLFAYNKSGDLLWKKNVDGIFAQKIDTIMTFQNGRRRNINLTDIDGDGKNEILLTGTPTIKAFLASDSVYCLNYDGSKRWTISPESEEYNYAPKWKRTKWIVVNFFTAKFMEETKLYVMAVDGSYGGAIISSVDQETGKITSTIFHSGHFTTQTNLDLDKDGNDEIYIGGISSFYKPYIMVLRQPFLMGVMPDFYSKEHKIVGNAWYYILLSSSRLRKIYSPDHSSNISAIYSFGQNGIMALSTDFYLSSQIQPGLQFAFNNNLEIQFVTGGSSFVMYYNEAKNKGLISGNLDSTFYKPLKDSIKYWDGDKFVNYPTPNKYWLQKFQRPK